MGALIEVVNIRSIKPCRNKRMLLRKNASPFVMGANAVYGAKEYGFRLYEISLGRVAQFHDLSRWVFLRLGQKVK